CSSFPPSAHPLDLLPFPTRRSSDLFRAVFPFFNLMYPSLTSQIMEGLVNTYKESGWLPEWASPGHRESMIGSNSASIVAEAYLKDRKSTRLNSSHVKISYAVFCLKK